MKRYCSVALVLVILVAFFSSKYSVEGRSLMKISHSSQAVRDMPISEKTKEAKPLKGEKDSLRKIPWSGASPIQNKCKPPVVVEGTRKQQITGSRKP